MPLVIIGREEVRRELTYEVCIPLIREAMMALSHGETQQLPRGIIDLEQGRAFGVMAGAFGPAKGFGAKLVSVFPDNFAKGLQSHQGILAIFDPATGAPVCLLHAGEVTAIRTAAASAVATDALARPDASRLAVLGYGEQAEGHVVAISKIRDLEAVTVWGRSPERASAFAERVGRKVRLSVRTAATVQAAVAEADIICTTTAASEPILHGAWVRAGAHLNLVGSSRAGPSEVDHELVLRSRFIADYREAVLRQGAEFLSAKNAGLIDDFHVVGEIGQVLAGTLAGRRSSSEITLYKSLGNVMQDLASGWYLYKKAVQGGGAAVVPF